MRTNKFLLVSLAAAMMAGCADDEFVTNNGINGNEGLKGELVKAGLLGIGRSEADTQTRAYNPAGNFVWMPSELTANGELTADRKNQKVGLCWTGVAKDGFGAVDVADQKVYTNYEYEHVGWLDVEATAPKVDPCDDSTLLNGAYIIGEGTPEAKFEGTFNNTGRWNKYYYGETTGKYENTSEWAGSESEYTGDLALGRGVFATKNASVFKGQYLAYYPYTNDFKQGQIVAHEPTTFTVEQTADRYATASDVAFSIGLVDDYEGGNSASGIGAKTLSGFLIAKLCNYNKVKSPDKKTIKTVVFYSETAGILYKQDLNAGLCVAALKKGSLGNGEELYYTSAPLFREKTNAIVANLTKDGNEGFELIGTAIAPTKNDDYAWVALPVLPQTISDLHVILIDDKDRSCDMLMESGAIEPNKALVKEINVDECEFVNEYLAVDEASFLSAMDKIKNNGSTDDDIEANRVKLLRDIKMTFAGDAVAPYVGNGKYAGIYNSLFFDKNIKIYSACGAKLIVTADTKMHIKNLASTVEGTPTPTPTLTIDVPVVVEGAGCCGNKVAKLSVGGAQNVAQPCHVVMTQDVENYGTLALGNNASGNTSVEINGTLTNKLDGYAEERYKTIDAAKVYLVGGLRENSAAKITINKVVNEGDVYSRANALDIWGDDQNPDVRWFEEETVAENRVVNTEIKTLENKKKVEIAKNTMITVATKLDNSEATSVIDIIGEGFSVKDGRLDVKATTAANKGTIDNKGVVNFTGNSLVNEGLFIDQLSGQVGGKMINNGTATGATTKTYDGAVYSTDLGVKGIYVSQVATVERMGKVLSDEVLEPSTVILEILGCDAYFYNFGEFEKNMADKDVYINVTKKNVAGKQISFKSFEEVDGKPILTESCFGHCVTVLSGNKLATMEGVLNTVKDVKVEEGGEFVMKKFGNSFKGEQTQEVKVTIGQDLINEGKVTHEADLLTVKRDLMNENSFTSKKNFEVHRNVETGDGDSVKFDSEGENNLVKGNFTQTGGEVTFAMKTTTKIEGTFACNKGKFEREGLNGNTTYRATVNVGTLGATNGTTNTAWPTEIANANK